MRFISDHGEAELEVNRLGGEENREAVTPESCVAILSDILVYSNNISLKVRDRVEEMEQFFGEGNAKTF